MNFAGETLDAGETCRMLHVETLDARETFE